MRNLLFACGLVCSLLAIALVPAPADAGCVMVNLQGDCYESVIKISWNFLCTTQCEPKVVLLERKCGLNGRWEPIAEGIESPYADRLPYECGRGWYYRLTWEVDCPDPGPAQHREILGPIFCD